MSTREELLALRRELDAAIEALEPTHQPEPEPSGDVCTRCQERPRRKPNAYLCQPCSNEVRGRTSTPTGYVRERIRARKANAAETQAKRAATTTQAERIVAAVAGVGGRKGAQAQVVVHDAPGALWHAVNTLAKPLAHEVGTRSADFRARTSTVTFDRTAAADALVSAVVAAGGKAERL